MGLRLSEVLKGNFEAKAARLPGKANPVKTGDAKRWV
jgi:hypothetical protein